MTPADVVIAAEAVLGRKLNDFEMKLVQTVLSKRIGVEATWNEIFGVLEIKDSDIARRALLLQVKAAATDADYENVARILRDDAETRLKRMGWGS